MVIYGQDLCADCTGPILGESVPAEITNLNQDHRSFSLAACFAILKRGLRLFDVKIDSFHPERKIGRSVSLEYDKNFIIS